MILPCIVVMTNMKTNMKIGVFDSGLGGLIILKAIIKRLPEFDYVYLGDTKNLPYGNKSQNQIYAYLQKAVKFLFNQDCALVIVACNTASAIALRKIQQQYLPRFYPNRRILGVIRSTTEQIGKSGSNRVLLIGTKSTIDSKSYIKELKKIDKKINIKSLATPDLVPLLEDFKIDQAEESIKKYLSKYKFNKYSIILGCTHYPLLKKYLRKSKTGLTVFSQDEIIPDSLNSYLNKHSELKNSLSKKATIKLFVTKTSKEYQKKAVEWFSKKIKIQKVSLN